MGRFESRQAPILVVSWQLTARCRIISSTVRKYEGEKSRVNGVQRRSARAAVGEQASNACSTTAWPLSFRCTMKKNLARRLQMRIGCSIAAWSIALALGLRPASALDPSTRITQYRHSAWRVQDGAFESAPNAVAQTADGYIWIGTGSGLVKYDGVRFAPWAPPPGKSLANPNIISLLGSSDGTLWIGTAGGLLSWKNNDLREQLRYRMNGIIQDHKGRIWVARSRSHETGGFCQVTGEHPGCLGADDRLNLPNAGAIAEDLHGNLWVGGKDQLLRWHEGSFDAYFREQLAPLNLPAGFNSVAAAADGSVWAGVHGEKNLALVHIVDGSPKPIRLAGVKSQSFTTLFADREGSLWLGSSDHGLYRLNGGRVDHFGSEDGLSSNTVAGVFEDREGNLWVATSKGLDFFRDSRVITFSASEGLSSDYAASVLASDDGTVWIGNTGASRCLPRRPNHFHTHPRNQGNRAPAGPCQTPLGWHR